MANKINIGALGDVLAAELSNYTIGVAEEVKKAVDDTSKELLANTKADAPRRNGAAYAKAMKIKTLYESQFEKRNRWYVDQKGGLYRLSHLLEKGHALRNGKRARAFPHIQKNEEKAKQAFNDRVERAIKNGK